jgi:hypothetical protein
MNYYTTFMLILSITIQQHCNGMENKLSHTIVNEHYQPTSPLLNILEATSIQHDGTLQSIYTETQKSWLRTADKERWENQTVITMHHANPSELFKTLCLIQEIKPSKQHYNHVVLLGSTVISIRNRLAYLIDLWNDGIRFDSINILAGQRPLDKTIESPEILLKNSCPALNFKQNWQLSGQLPTTETDMIKLVFDQTELPSEWNNITINFVDTPMQQTENGTIRRPNTLDTVLEWIKLYNPHGGSVLAISSQPYIGYQDSVLRNFLPKKFTVETVGRDCINNQNIATILDSLARWIYNEYQMYKSAH